MIEPVRDVYKGTNILFSCQLHIVFVNGISQITCNRIDTSSGICFLIYSSKQLPTTDSLEDHYRVYIYENSLIGRLEIALLLTTTSVRNGRTKKN